MTRNQGLLRRTESRSRLDVGPVMTIKPPTKTFPKLVMKEWPDREQYDPAFVRSIDEAAAKPPEFIGTADEVLDFLDIGRRKALSDFTRVLEGVREQERPQKEKSRDE